MDKIDLKKDLKYLYNPSAKEVYVVQVPDMNFLMIDGEWDPNTSPQFQAAMEALFGASFTLKFTIKKSGGQDYSVMPPEGLWWAERLSKLDFDAQDPQAWANVLQDKGGWKWTLMIAQPDFITEEQVQDAIKQVQAKKDSPALSQLRFERFHEGKAIQIMHVGPYSAEPANIAKMHRFAKENGLKMTGKHHEIYLSDPRRAAPEKLKTVLRQGVTP